MSGFAMTAIFTLLLSVFVASTAGILVVKNDGVVEQNSAFLDEYGRLYDHRHANITIVKITYSGGVFEVTVKNTGNVVLDPDHVFLAVDGDMLPEGGFSVDLAQGSRAGYWEPAEELRLRLNRDFGPGWHTVSVANGKGVTAEKRFYMPYDAMMVYYDSFANRLPRYRLWDGSAWSDEGSAGNVGGDVRWMVLKASPTRNEYALVTLDGNGDINGQVWQNGSWLGPLEMSSGIDSRYRGFDVEYEQVSGDVMVVYSDGTSIPKYLVWDGEAITQTGSVLPIGSGVPRWIVLASDPNSDEIILMTLDTNRDIYAQVWNGNSWGNVQLLELSAETNTRQCFDAAYESTSGRALVVWADSRQRRPQYRIWTGSSWTIEASANDVGSSNIYWIRLASEPGSDRILMGTLDRANDVNVQIWTGSFWGTNLEVTRGAESDNRRTFDVAFEGSSGIGMISYGESNDRPRFRTCTGQCFASDWSLENSANDVNPAGGDPEWIQLIPDPNSNDIFLMHADDARDIGIQRWIGSLPWIDANNMETRSRFDYEAFSMAFRQHYPGGYAWD